MESEFQMRVEELRREKFSFKDLNLKIKKLRLEPEIFDTEYENK